MSLLKIALQEVMHEIVFYFILLPGIYPRLGYMKTCASLPLVVGDKRIDCRLYSESREAVANIGA